MRKSSLVGALILAAACTARNPLYLPAQDLGTVDLSGVPARDLAGPDLAGVNLALSGCPGGKTRTCRLGTPAVSQLCVGAQYRDDRVCPAMSACVDGYCEPPPSGSGSVGHSCSEAFGPAENMCFGGGGGGGTELSCQPFIENPAKSEATWVCAARVGMGTPGTPCTAATQTQCRSGFCGSNGTCFRACRTVGDCPTGTGQLLQCNEVVIEVEGVSIKAKSCVP